MSLMTISNHAALKRRGTLSGNFKTSPSVRALKKGECLGFALLAMWAAQGRGQNAGSRVSLLRNEASWDCLLQPNLPKVLMQDLL
jgi:hypothetical protein